VPYGATFCGRCGAPQPAMALSAPPVYTYPHAPQASFPARRRYGSSQIAIAGGLLAVLAVVTVAVSAFAVSRAIGSHSTCTVNCAPKFVTPLAESATYRSSAYHYEVDYSSAWSVRSQDANGISLGTRIGLLEVSGSRASQQLSDVLQTTVSNLPTAQWQDVVPVSDVKGAHIGDQDGLGAVYSANLIGAGSTAAKVRFSVIVATHGGVTVVIFAADPADPKNSPHGMPEAMDFDYLSSEFRWGT
jgi:hypothetical protein